MTTKAKTKRPHLTQKKAEQFVENARKLKFDCLARVKTLLSELNGHDFDPSDDCRSKYSKAAKFARELESFLVKHCEKPSTQVETVLASQHGSVNYGLSGAQTLTEAAKDCDSSPLMASGVTPVGYPVNYTGDRGSYSQCSGVETCSGRKEFLYSIR